MEARAVPALVAIFVCAHSAMSAGNDNDGGGIAAPAVAAVAVSSSPGYTLDVEPWIHPKMEPATRAKVEAGFDLAVCGRNPTANSWGGKVLAYTKVGGTPTWICRHFSRVSTETAAIAVIHEALHHAGLPEKPHDRLAMSSVEITEMVTTACGF